MIRLLLVGGGHAHLEILRRQILTPRRDLALTLVSQSERQHYSGMVPGFVCGLYTEAEISFDLEPLVARAGGRFVEARAIGISPSTREVLLDGAEPIPYDLVSFGVGSGAKGSETPGVAAHALSVKPIRRAVALKVALARLANSAGTGDAHVSVVGAGAAGFELACAAAQVVRRVRRSTEVRLVDAVPLLLSSASERVRNLAERVLREQGIALRLGSPVFSVNESDLYLETGERLPSDLTIWTTGPAAPEIFRESGLALDPAGFLLVNDALRSISHEAVFGVGDCVTLASDPETPKAGVYAVREAPVLWQSLGATIDGTPLPSYRPQRNFLSLLATADRRAILDYGPIALWNRPAFLLKALIDRRFMSRYQSLLVSS